MNDARAALDQGDRARALHAVNAALELDPEYLAAQALKERVERSPIASRRDPVPSMLESAPRPVTPQQERFSTIPAPEPPIVSAEGWARFEQRARSRRIDRRIGAARLAISRHRFAQARAILGEISEIDADHPDLISLGMELDAEEQMSRTQTRRWGPAIAASLIFAVVLSGASLLRSPELLRPLAVPAPIADTPVPTPVGVQALPAATDESPATTPAGASENPLAVDASTEPNPRSETPVIERAEAPVEAPSPRFTPPAPQQTSLAREDAERRTTAPAPPPDRPTPTIGRVETLPALVPTAPPPQPAAQSPPPPPAPSLTPAVAPAALPGNVSVEPAGALDTRALTREQTEPSRPSAAVSMGVVRARDEDLVRRTLQQYRTAYENLDARSAQAVWPQVDEAALQRAFAGLESQRLTFDDCQVQLRGTSGVATCRGMTLYVPKVGNREPHREPRVWTFDLRKVGESWQIDSARATR